MSSGTKAKSNYVLILFLDNESNNYIDIVPHSWLSVNQENDATYCKYMPPPYNARTSRKLQEMVKKNEKPPPTWSEYLVEIRGRAQTYEDAEERLLLLEKQPYAFTTDNEESAKLLAIKERKSLKIKSVGDLGNLKMTLDKSTINFDKDLRQSISPHQVKSPSNVKSSKKFMNVSSSPSTSSPLSSSFNRSNHNVSTPSNKNSSSSLDSDKSFQIQKKKKETKIDKNGNKVKHRLSTEKNDVNSSNDHLDNRSNSRKNLNENGEKSSVIRKRNRIEKNMNKNKKMKFDSSNEENVHQMLLNNQESLIIHDDKNSEVKNDISKIDQVDQNIIVRYFRSISKQIANLNGQVVLNTASIELLRTEIKKNKKCSCMNESHENGDISTDNESLFKSEFTFPLANHEIFVNFDNKIKDDSKYNSFIKKRLRKMISPKHTTVKNMGDVLRRFLSRDVALKFVPAKLSSKDITKKIFKDTSFYSSIQDGAKVAEFTVNSRPDLPTFKTSSQVFKVIEHETVVLPCEVTHPGQYVLAWKRGIAVLSAGSVKVTPEPRLRLMNSYSLEITDAQPSDAGDYTCQIGTLEPREITHTLEILVPPQIDYMTADGKVEVKKGSSVRLECRASGNPEPVITWSRRNNLLPSGEKTRASPSLTLERVDRHQAGVYQCTATNGIGQPAINQINVHVLYPPEITVERPMVYSGEGLEAHLVCIVYGETQPEVHWYRDTMLLDTTERRIMETRGSRHTLVIRKVHPSDFGNYTCVADNQLGKARKVIELTGKPNPAIFRSSTLGQWRDRYNISWMVESHAPLEELKLYYRKLPDQLEQEQLQPLQHQSQQIPRRYPKKDSTLMYGLASTSYHGGPGEWHDVLITGNRDRQPPMSYMIRGLEPQSLYEAKIQTRNKYGWSPVSPSFTFQTTSTDNVIRDIEVFPSYNNVGSISSSTSVAVKLQYNYIIHLCLLILLLFISKVK